MEDIHDPTDFSNSSLQRLDRELRCAICKDLYTTPMQLTTCIHSFCALCIRRRLAQERVCPACKTPADESKMIRNSSLDECVNTWRTAARQFVVTLEKRQEQPQPPQQQKQQPPPQQQQQPPPQQQQQSTSTTSKLESAQQSSTTSSSARRSARIGKQQQRYDNIITLDDEEDNDFQIQPNQVKSMTPKSPPVLASVDIPSTTTTTHNNIDNNNKSAPITQETQVQCFSCNQFMRQAVINEHIDRCLRGDSSIPEPPRSFLRQGASSSSNSSTPISSIPISSTINRRDKRQNDNYYGKKPIKLVYDMQKEKDLKKTLRDLGLPDHGDKQQMVWRHKEYVTLYYANLDAEHPKEGRTLIKQLNEAEEGYNNVRHHTNSQQLNIEEHNRRYKNQFDELIANARKRVRSQKQQEQEQQSSSVNNDNNNNTTTTTTTTTSSSITPTSTENK